jgi:O-acetyl-ADP-ribose deacetylase (regulator of RNase III)
VPDKLIYRKGDATAPIGTGPKILVHICNDIGKWGKGFVLAVSKRWREPEAAYLEAFERGALKLGEVQFVKVAPDLTVANVIGQHGVARRGRTDRPIRYDAIRAGLEKVAVQAQKLEASVHMPRIGTGLAGGHWTEIVPIIMDVLGDQQVTVYDYE